MCEKVNNSFNLNQEWDVEKYHNPLEPSGHWEIKKAFMLAHKHKYRKNRILTLTSTFYNMEFLGNRYHPEVEKLVSLLASDVPEIIEYREGKKRKLQRTFVSATDASRAKCLRTGSDIPKTNKDKIENRNHISQVESKMQKRGSVGELRNSSFISNVSNLSQSDIDLLVKVRSQPGFRGKIILYMFQANPPAFNVISESFKKIQCDFVIKPTSKMKDNNKEYIAQAGNDILARDFAESYKKARDALSSMLLASLQETCFTVMVKTNLQGQSINKLDTQTTERETKVQEPSELIPSDNKGARMMKLMGWTGQGLGKNKDGIKKPIEASKNVYRLGLGLNESCDVAVLQQTVTKHLREYISDPGNFNLVFSNEYSIEERKIIHGIAQKLKLKSKSYGSGDKRQLVISKKLEPWQLVEQLLACGDETPTHKLLRPTKIM